MITNLQIRALKKSGFSVYKGLHFWEGENVFAKTLLMEATDEMSAWHWLGISEGMDVHQNSYSRPQSNLFAPWLLRTHLIGWSVTYKETRIWVCTKPPPDLSEYFIGDTMEEAVLKAYLKVQSL